MSDQGMSIPPADLSAYAKLSDLQALAIPTPAAGAPPAVATASTPGTLPQYARADHTHLSSIFRAVVATVDTSGNVTWTYPPGFFSTAPVIELTVQTAGTQAMQAQITSNTAAGGSAKIIASQPLPTLTSLSGALTLLSGVISAVNVALSQLTNFNVFGGAVPVGTQVHVMAAKAS